MKAFSWFLLAPILSLLWISMSRGAGIVFPNDSSVLNLKTSFGAYGDGVHNDTVALQNGLDASGGISGPSKILFIPNGVYLVTNTIVDHTIGPWVYGESRDGVIIRMAVCG
jgi:hypothetical protein